MIENIISKRPLTIFKLVMMAVIAIDSIKNLPANAQYGNSLLFFYLLATVAFFIPSALVAAELATAWPQTGGMYVWVREAFGVRMAFLAVWIQWLYTIIWYPTILSFIAVTIAYLISPALAENKYYVLFAILGIFWLATYLNSLDIKISSRISVWSALIGVIIPMFSIAGLGAYWLYTQHAAQINFSWQAFTTVQFNTDNLRLLVNLLFSLLGIEMVAVHAGDVKNPSKSYPLVIIISAFIILATVIPSSLAIATVIPNKEIGLATGVVEAFSIFLTMFHLQHMQVFVVTAIAVGGFGIFLVWLLATTRCLLIAAQDKSLPVFLQKTNSKKMPIGILLTQGIFFTILASVFILMPSINNAFWLLTAASSQLALIYYLFLFGSALRLRYKYPQQPRPFRAGNTIFLWSICLLASLTCLVAIICGFLPPSDLSSQYHLFYEFSLIGLIAGSFLSAFWIYSASRRRNEKLDISAIPDEA